LPHQPQLDATPTQVTLGLPEGWRFVAARGVQVDQSGRVATLDRALDRTERVRVRIARDRGSGLWGRLQRGTDLAVAPVAGH
jgi:hypothetical protein